MINEVIRANLRNVHINHVGIVTIQLKKFILAVESFQVNVVLSINVLVRQNDAGHHKRVACGSFIVVTDVFTNLALINSEVEVLLGDNFIVSLTCELHFLLLILEID